MKFALGVVSLLVTAVLASPANAVDLKSAAVNVRLNGEQCHAFAHILDLLGVDSMIDLTENPTSVPGQYRFVPIKGLTVQEALDANRPCNPMKLNLPKACGGDVLVVLDPVTLEKNGPLDNGQVAKFEGKSIVASGREAPGYFGVLTKPEGASAATRAERIHKQIERALYRLAKGDANKAAGELALIRHKYCPEATYAESKAAHDALNYLAKPDDTVGTDFKTPSSAGGAGVEKQQGH
jgi:hypothetical protein